MSLQSEGGMNRAPRPQRGQRDFGLCRVNHLQELVFVAFRVSNLVLAQLVSLHLPFHNVNQPRSMVRFNLFLADPFLLGW